MTGSGETLGAGLVGAIPSPSDGSLHVGPIELRAYGVMIALGVLAAWWIADRRWRARGGNEGDLAAIATWAVPAGVVGARAYHVITDPQLFQGRWWHVLAIWEGGLGIPGGIAAGVLVGAWVARRRGLPIGELLDVVAPALPVAQAIGRWGNWFNQELFGEPTRLPWALRIDRANRPDGYEQFSSFHPTFLYESMWNLALAAGLVWLGRRWHRPPGRLFAAYVAGYGLGRLWVEALRIDPANTIAGLRINIWMSLAAIAAGTVAMLWPARGDRTGGEQQVEEVADRHGS